jgi:hypothetical protein
MDCNVIGGIRNVLYASICKGFADFMGHTSSARWGHIISNPPDFVPSPKPCQ